MFGDNKKTALLILGHPVEPKRMATGGTVSGGYANGGYAATDAEGHDGMHVAAADLMHALETKDTRGVVQSVRAMFQMLEAEPHSEGPEEEMP